MIQPAAIHVRSGDVIYYDDLCVIVGDRTNNERVNVVRDDTVANWHVDQFADRASHASIVTIDKGGAATIDETIPAIMEAAE